MPPPDLAIRPLAPEEREAWEPLWQDYLTFYEFAGFAANHGCIVAAAARSE